MNPTSLVPTLALLLLPACSDDGGTSGAGRRYPVKAGVIEYAIDGPMKGTETLYFDGYGAREAKVTKQVLTVGGHTQETHTLTITEGDWITTVDLRDNTGSRIKNPYADLLGSLGDGDPHEVGAELMRRMGGTKTGTEEVLGKTCDVWELTSAGAKTWSWQGIPLKTQVAAGPMTMLSTATRVALEESVPSTRFEVPEGVTITDRSDLMKRLGR